ncbi:MAG: ATP-binding protein [Thermodesulfobacteriota bacterium]
MEHLYSLLVADDERVIREGIQRILNREKVRITLAEDGIQTWELFQKQGFDLLLLDLKMPGLEGMEILRRIKEHSPDQIVIVITGQATIEAAVEAMKFGAYDFITKPFLPDHLRLAVRRALEKRRLEMEARQLLEERTKSLKDIALEQSRIQTIIRSMASGVLVTDHNQVVVLHNPALAHLLRLPDDPLIGKPLPENPSLKILTEAIGQVLQKNGPLSLFQESSLGDENPIFLRTHTAAVTDEEAGILGSVSVIEDISYLKNLDRMKNEFVAMVAHELRAPLSAIHQQISVILEGLAGDTTPKQQELLKRSQERADGLLSLIRDLLDISKMETGRSFQQKTPLDLLALTEKTVALMTSSAQAKNQVLTLKADPDLPRINADPEAMEEMLTNLISNAVKFTPEQGSIEVLLKSEADHLLIQVSDNGIGIAPDDLTRIFDRFYRVKNEKTRKIVGTGLGLPIVKKIIEAHLGYIQVESQPDRGTTFKIRIPCLIQERKNHGHDSAEKE